MVLTARDCFQVCDLADLFRLNYKRIGRHFGKHKLLKAIGLSLRALQLLPTGLHERPALALSHGSRAQTMVAAILGIPSIVILDYEYARFLPGLKPTWVIAPEVIPSTAIRIDEHRILQYPGIKEDVYVPTFTPDPGIMTDLALDESEIIVTARPPANEAHYYNPESDRLFHAAMDFLLESPHVKIVVVPRNAKQAYSVQRTWPQGCSSGKMILPNHAVDGLNLIWHSDLVISGGGTMNREAAALGVPVYSVFRGTIGAVDRYLASRGRLVLLESVEEVRTKLVVRRRNRPSEVRIAKNEALKTIVDHVLGAMEAQTRGTGNEVGCGAETTQ